MLFANPCRERVPELVRVPVARLTPRLHRVPLHFVQPRPPLAARLELTILFPTRSEGVGQRERLVTRAVDRVAVAVHVVNRRGLPLRVLFPHLRVACHM